MREFKKATRELTADDDVKEPETARKDQAPPPPTA
jgi:hypothetical protein